jgi:glycosyltransferase involved in cell wall biosynthesis
MENRSEITISIGLACCNHAAFVRQAIDSILVQKHPYAFEICIADDASEDGTQDVLKEYAENHPDIIRLLLSEKRLGPNATGRKIFQAMRGKYCCWLDGDDYWSHEEKLFRQIDFLESNPEYSGCFHDALIVAENNEKYGQSLARFKTYSQFNRYDSDFFMWDLLRRNIIPTAALVFRYTDMNPFFDRMEHVRLSLQWAIQLYIIQFGRFKYINQTWSVYRDHAQGISKQKSAEEFNHTNLHVLRYFKHSKQARSFLTDILIAIHKEYRLILTNSEWKKSRSYYLRILWNYLWLGLRITSREKIYFLSRIIRK